MPRATGSSTRWPRPMTATRPRAAALGFADGARAADQSGHAPCGHPAQSPALGRILPSSPLCSHRRGAYLPGRLRLTGRVRPPPAAPHLRHLPERRSCPPHARVGPAVRRHAQVTGRRRRGVAGNAPTNRTGALKGPQFIATSATIANPGEHFTLLTGLPVTVVADDGSPHGPRHLRAVEPAVH